MSNTSLTAGVLPAASLASRVRRLVASDALLVSAVFALLLVVFTYAEHPLTHDGLGEEGSTNAQLARDYRTRVLGQGVDDYLIQRVSLPVLVHYCAKLFHYPLSDHAAVKTWRALDLLFLTLAAWLWCVIVRELGIGQRGRWLGVLFLFVNFAVLKWCAYNSAAGDAATLALGLAMLLCYLQGRSFTLAALSLLGAFTWPAALQAGVLLLLFPRKQQNSEPATPAPSRLHLLIAAAAALWVWQVLHQHDVTFAPLERALSHTYVNLGITLACAYVFFGLALLLNDGRLFRLEYFRGRLADATFWLGIAVWATARMLQYRLTVVRSPLTVEYLSVDLLWSAVLHPGVFLVAHAIYFGPVVVLAFLLWKPVCTNIQRQGTGLVVVMAFALPLALCSDSRQLIVLLPLLVPFVVQAVEEVSWGWTQVGFVAVLSVLASKVWLTINPDTLANLLQLNVGPCMSAGSYGVQAAFVVFAGYVLYPLVHPSRAVRVSQS